MFAYKFLSRLCGGEAKSVERAARSKFLSRLCGGEVIEHHTR